MKKSSIRIQVFALLLCSIAARAEPLAAGWVPSSFLRQGQISLYANGTNTELEVLLNSRFMDRVVNKIIGKEQNNWPGNHPDATAYIENTRAARKQLQAGDGIEVLQIVFSLAPAPGVVTWKTGTVEEDSRERWHLKSPAELARIEPSREYLVRNAALILADSLGLEDKEIHRLLAAHLDASDLHHLPELIDD